jgi:hypothetical protein
VRRLSPRNNTGFTARANGSVMQERAVFVLCFVAALLSGTALFYDHLGGTALWLDLVFLIAAAICLALAVLFLAKRLRRVGRDAEGGLWRRR